ncbi:hypothetical protein Herbaro_11990 [Herbaspirillum sp. WKF16]|uniref:YncE family protein n=1 Tax=Herbaspirillum sp. WKF16 TaxID=3028312 RepID=UPI0023A9AC0A|nr:hypothetical protein [Herbaspirillum sp. WKF16]WDZ94220.1 hypothetical protein Herbaro_11990 [Herbaspirillum sp. WKF16]
MRAMIATLLLAGGLQAGSAGAADAMPALSLRADVLPGSGHSWGLGALDPTRPYLFLARRENGLTVFDTAAHAPVKNVAGTEGANAVAFAPQLDRAYVAYMDGSLGVLRLSDLTQLQRIAVDDGNLNNLVFDAVSGHLLITSGRRAGRSAIWLFDPRDGRVVKRREFDARKFDAPLGLADGSVLLPLRDEGRVMRISAATLETLPGWSGKQFPGCEHPSALAADEKQGRLFVACRGKKPQLTIAGLDDGAPLAWLPAAPAINALAWDGARRLLLVPSGDAASLTLVGQDAGGAYRALGFAGTRPWAHNMAYDAARGVAYLFTMDFSQPAPDAAGQKQDPQFHPDSFTVLSVSLRP